MENTTKKTFDKNRNIISPPQKSITKKFFLIFSSLLVLCLIIVPFVIPKEPFVSDKNLTVADTKPNPTQMPFFELTIPYLQKREYESSLGPLTEVSRNTSYTSYKTYYTSDGLRVNAQLTIPNEEMPIDGWSAIIFVHGYIPPASYNTFENYASYVDYLASQGFVVLKIDLRGHGESEGEAGGAYYSSDYVIDVLNAKSALEKEDFVKPNGIGLWGHSMAGNVVARAMAASEEIPAVVIWAGAVYSYEDFQKYSIQDNSYRPPSEQSQARRRRNELFSIHGEFDPESPFWSKVPVTNYLSDVKGAIQIHHALNDDVVDIGFSRDFAKLLKSAGIEHTLIEYPTGGHNFTGNAFNEAMQNTVNFFKRHLQ